MADNIIHDHIKRLPLYLANSHILGLLTNLIKYFYSKIPFYSFQNSPNYGFCLTYSLFASRWCLNASWPGSLTAAASTVGTIPGFRRFEEFSGEVSPSKLSSSSSWLRVPPDPSSSWSGTRSGPWTRRSSILLHQGIDNCYKLINKKKQNKQLMS